MKGENKNRMFLPEPFQFLEQLPSVISGNVDASHSYSDEASFQNPRYLDIQLSQREEKVLDAVVCSYIKVKKPVGSRILSQSFPLQLSPASIRNVLADLEAKGFVESAHRSAGRIPNVRSYRYFVDHLMQFEKLSLDDEERIKREYLKEELKIEKILQVSSKVLSHICNYTGIILGPSEDYNILKHIELISVTPLEILFVLVTRSGKVLHKSIFVDEPVVQDELYKISKFLNATIKGYDIKNIRENIIPELIAKSSDIKFLSMVLAKFHEHLLNNPEEEQLYFEGLENINSMFEQDEQISYKAIFSLFEDKTILRKIYSQSINTNGINSILLEKDNEVLPGITLITTHYKIGEKKVGSLGIAGPNRMDYARVYPVLNYVSSLVSDLITGLVKQGRD